jgi:hypothetical protein
VLRETGDPTGAQPPLEDMREREGVTAQNVISMLVLYHEHNGFAKIKLLGLFK